MISYEAIELSIFLPRTFTFQIIRWRYIYTRNTVQTGPANPSPLRPLSNAGRGCFKISGWCCGVMPWSAGRTIPPTYSGSHSANLVLSARSSRSLRFTSSVDDYSSTAYVITISSLPCFFLPYRTVHSNWRAIDIADNNIHFYSVSNYIVNNLSTHLWYFSQVIQLKISCWYYIYRDKADFDKLRVDF